MSATKRAPHVTAGANTASRGTSEIAAAMLTVSRAFTKARAHATLCRRAGVELDRSGSALLYNLLAEGEGVHLSVLAERLEIDPPAVSRKVQQLERLGYVVRTPDTLDGRAILVSLSREGRDAVERLLAARLEWMDEILADWPAHERLELSELLQKLAEAIGRTEQSNDR